MAKYQITGPDGAKYEVEAPDTASSADVLKFAQRNFQGAKSAPGMSALDRFGTGVKDPFVGATQLGAHLISNIPGVPDYGKRMDEYAAERERGIDEARGPAAGTDWWGR